MTNSDFEPVVDLRLFVKGEELDPGDVAKVLGSPSKSKRKGDVSVTSTGHTVRAKLGLWSLEASRDRGFQDQLLELLTRLDGRGTDLRTIHGVERALLSLFVVVDSSDPDCRQHVYELTPDQMMKLASKGIELEISVGSAAS